MSSTAVSHHMKQRWSSLLDFQQRDETVKREGEREGGGCMGQTIRFIIVCYIRNQNNLSATYIRLSAPADMVAAVN